MYYPRVAIIILNWNGGMDTLLCLESVFQNVYTNFDVIVVDNGSTDDSIQKLKEYALGEIEIRSSYAQYRSDNKPIVVYQFPLETQTSVLPVEYSNLNPARRMILLCGARNYGFCKGNNEAIKFARQKLHPSFVLLLNNDTVVSKNFLQELVRVTMDFAKTGLAQPKVLKMGQPDIIDAVGIALESFGDARQIGYLEPDRGQYSETTEVWGVNGCCELINTSMINQIGLLDEDFFAYYDDVDLSWRARLTGWKSIYVPSSIIYHAGSVSGSKIKNYLTARNLFLYLVKEAPWIFVVAQAIRAIGLLVVSKSSYNISRRLRTRAFLDSCHLFTKMLRKRVQISLLADQTRYPIHVGSGLSNEDED
ncbi:MAG TPA: glycosyltransferase family 2 protein [Nitrososphaerales archaeon]|nr:glycosyltransferase family 2 protein [Nitrososphaerales archaeon]